jgi:hypothetical protein
MEDKIYDIITDLLRGDITKDECISKLLNLDIKNISLDNISFFHKFVNEFTDTEIPKQAIKETLNNFKKK